MMQTTAARKAKINQHLEGSAIADQLRLEQDAVTEGVKRYRYMVMQARNRGEEARLKPVERLMRHWFASLRKSIELLQRRVRTGTGMETYRGWQVWGPVMLMLNADRLAVLTMHEVMRMCLDDPEGSVPFVEITYKVGRAAVAEIQLDMLKRTQSEAYRAMSEKISRINPACVNWYTRKNLDDPIWSYRLCTHLGAQLVYLLVNTAETGSYLDDEPENSFYLPYRYQGVKSIKHLTMTRRALEVIEDGHSARELLHPRYLPMVVPPLRWSKDNEGGFLRIRTPLISKPTKGQKEAIAEAEMGLVYDALNAIAEVPWRLNRTIYDGVQKYWSEGGGSLGIPPRDDTPLPPRIEGDKARSKERHDLFQYNRSLKGIRKTFDLCMTIAAKFGSTPKFYLPHYLDFRGRSYPLPIIFNHQGEDRIRSMFEFGEQMAVTDSGYAWLMVHAANRYGLDKLSFADRIGWCESVMGEIERCASDPDSTDFWQRADGGDQPWQFLAACRALVDEDAGARLPVQIDGRCNGLQHYAALGLDLDTAKAVSMVEMDAPNRIYDDVARATARKVDEDAERGEGWIQFKERDGTVLQHEIRKIAQSLAGHITDKVVKAPVMTSVYGVTMVGARQQTYDKLADVIADEAECYRASMYLSRVVLDSMDEIVPSARRIMRWLEDVARIVAVKLKRPLRWTTPLGFPVVQPYRRMRDFCIRTVSGDITKYAPCETMPVLAKRQVNGFAPNVIHSWDATHMMMTCLEMRRRGHFFAGVHDSFWSHASSMDELSMIAREQFVELHQRDLLGDLYEQMRKQHPGVEFPEPPAKGDFDLREVLKAKYMFS